MADLRMPDINEVRIAGRLTRDPELRYIPSGAAVCEIGVAADRRWRDKDGNQKEETLFVDVTTWGQTAEFIGEHFKKGRAVLVSGRLKSQSWADRDGNKRSKVSITADRVQSLEWKDDGQAERKASKQEAPGEPEGHDDIPF